MSEYVKLFKLRSPNHLKEKLAARYFYENPSPFIIPILKVESNRYFVAEGTPITFCKKLGHWLEDLWLWLRTEEWSHNDFNHRNIVAYQGSYRLIDFETWDFSGSTFADWDAICSLHRKVSKHILNSKDSSPGTYLSQS